jgi:hypothetical protein
LTICIVCGCAIRTAFGNSDVVIIPSTAEIRFVGRQLIGEQERHLAATGTRTVLVVRVTSLFSAQFISSAENANTTFGVEGLQNSMARQFKSYSANKLNFVAASGHGSIKNGVMDLVLDVSVNGKNIFALENSMTTAVQDALGVTDLKLMYSNVLFCTLHGTTFYTNGPADWLGYAYNPGQFSYYKNGKWHNLAEGFRFQTQEYANEVTIVQSASNKADSSLESALSARKSAVIGKYTIDVCDVVNTTSSSPKYATISIRLNSQSSACQRGTPAPST